MIAIPIDAVQEDTKSSILFGNVAMFALYDAANNTFKYVKNDGAGNGIKTAKFIKDCGATTTIYSYMGDGPFKELSKNDVAIFYIGKEPLKIANIVKYIDKELFIKVDSSNASTYLDPGTATQNCECGCS